jgi:hypothetical protein
MSQTYVFKIDLGAIDGDGDFPCPRCGSAVSPDDNTDEAYSILETKTNTHGLEEVTIRCNKCLSHIHLTGFSLLQQIEPDQEKPQNQKQKKD